MGCIGLFLVTAGEIADFFWFKLPADHDLEIGSRLDLTRVKRQQERVRVERFAPDVGAKGVVPG
jgi:hypothetical protein